MNHLKRLLFAILLHGWHYNSEWGYLQWNTWEQAWHLADFHMNEPLSLMLLRSEEDILEKRNKYYEQAGI